MTNKTLTAKGQLIKPYIDTGLFPYNPGNSKRQEVFIRKGKNYHGKLLKKQKSFAKLPF